MYRRFPRPLVLASLAGVAGLALWLFAAGASGDRAHRPTAKAAQAAVPNCTANNPQPLAPLELNSVEVDGVVKTVAMEKDIFTCQQTVGNLTQNFTRDLETFVEIVERGSANSVSPVSRRVVVSTCDANTSTGIVTCDKTAFTPALQAAPLGGGCNQPSAPADPVEMNTVAVHDAAAPSATPPWMKTIKVDKQITSCNDGTQPLDLYTFTELFEKRTGSGATASYSSATTHWEGIACTRDKTQAVVTGCTRFVNGQ